MNKTMGSNQSKKSNLSTYEYSKAPNGNINTGAAPVNRSISGQNLHRSPSSPIMACIKPQFNFRDLDNNAPYNGSKRNSSNNNNTNNHHLQMNGSGLNHHVHGKQNSSNLNSSKSSISTNTHSTPSPRTPIKHNQLQAEPRRLQPQPTSRPPVNGQQHKPPVIGRNNSQLGQLSKQFRSNQQKLNNMIKESTDSKQNSYQVNSSKLYKPAAKSLLASNQNQTSLQSNAS